MERFRIGDMEVTRIFELSDECPPEFLLPTLPPGLIEEHLHWLAPNFLNPVTRSLFISMHSWVIRTPRHTVLVDTCGGNHKEREHFPVFHQRDTRYLDRLHQAGFAPEDIDFVFCTHLHIDHVGWNTRLRDGCWVPTFPNARYLFSKAEYEAANPLIRGAIDAHGDRIFADSVLPVVKAGLALQVDGHHQIDDSLFIEPAIGHTIGHSLMKAKSRGQTGVFSGDVLHHPLQVVSPETSSAFCWNPALAAETRIRVLTECAEHNHLFFPGHFGAPHACRIGHGPKGFVLR